MFYIYGALLIGLVCSLCIWVEDGNSKEQIQKLFSMLEMNMSFETVNSLLKSPTIHKPTLVSECVSDMTRVYRWYLNINNISNSVYFRSITPNHIQGSAKITTKPFFQLTFHNNKLIHKEYHL